MLILKGTETHLTNTGGKLHILLGDKPEGQKQEHAVGFVTKNWSKVDDAPSQIPMLPTKSKAERWQNIPPGMTQYQILSLIFFPHLDPCDPNSIPPGHEPGVKSKKSFHTSCVP